MSRPHENWDDASQQEWHDQLMAEAAAEEAQGNYYSAMFIREAAHGDTEARGGGSDPRG